MKKAMISQPMRNLSDEEILAVREQATNMLEASGYSVINTFFTDEEFDYKIKSIPLFLLGESLKRMSECDAVCFCNEWREARGCNIEHDAALAYGLKILYFESVI